VSFQPALWPEQHDSQHDDHQYADRTVHQRLVEINSQRRADDRSNHGRHGEPRTLADNQRTAPAKRRDGDDVLHEYADAICAVRYIRRQAEQDQDGQRDQRPAAGQRVDETGNESNDRNRGKKQDIGIDGCGSFRQARNANRSMRAGNAAGKD
jgi:hypothetical protein